MNGSLIWEHTTGGAVYSSPAVLGGRVYIRSDDGNLYCLYASNGTEIWSYPTLNNIRSSPTIINGKVYFGSDDTNIYCVNVSNGLKIWDYPTMGRVRSSPAIADNIVYVGSDDGDIYLLNATSGALIRTYLTLSMVCSSPAIAEDKVYVGSLSGMLYTIESNGSGVYSNYLLDGAVSSSPAIQNMRLFIGTENGYIYCFRDHNPPNVPDRIDGPTEGLAKEKYDFVTNTEDPEEDKIFYMFDWGDGNSTEWLGPFEQNEDCNSTYKWSLEGYYNVTVKTKDHYGFESNWSEPLTIHIISLKISYTRGGIGLHAAIKNIGTNKTWRVKWNISIEGGLIANPSTRFYEGEILSISPDDEEMIITGPFIELGKIKITVCATDRSGQNSISTSFTGWAFGFLLFLAPYR